MSKREEKSFSSSSKSKESTGGSKEKDVRMNSNDMVNIKKQNLKKKRHLDEMEVDEDKVTIAVKEKEKTIKRQQSTDEEDSQASSSADSEDGVIEDEDGALVTPEIEAQILKTLAEIKAKDPKVYNPSVTFFKEEDLQKREEEWQQKKKENEDKPLSLREYQRDLMLKGQLDNSEEEEEDPAEVERTFEEEQKAVLDEFLKVAADEGKKILHSASDEEDDFLKIKPKNEEDVAKEDEDYKAFILENLANHENAREYMSEWFREGGPSGRGQSATNEEQFLIEYVLNRGWVDKATGGKSTDVLEEIIKEDEVDEEALEKMEEFEEKYNFRHEQPGGTEIISYGKVEGSLRREESKRKAQREARKKRKLEEKERLREELKRLKNIKKGEIEERLRKLGVLADNDLIDLEGDFDAEEHDRKMAKVFDDEYYNENDEVKPEWSDEDDAVEGDDAQEEEEQVNIIERDPTSSALSKKAAKRKLQKQKKQITKHLDEYYQLDYEDMIGDLPCRFKYQKVHPTTFGLKIRDILEADDADLNRHVGMKRLAAYRSVEDVRADEARFGSKGRVYKFYDSLKRKYTQQANEPADEPAVKPE